MAQIEKGRVRTPRGENVGDPARGITWDPVVRFSDRLRPLMGSNGSRPNQPNPRANARMGGKAGKAPLSDVRMR